MQKRLYPYLNFKNYKKIFKKIDYNFNFENFTINDLHKIENEMYKIGYKNFINDFCQNLKQKTNLVINYFKKEGFSEEYAKICIQQQFIKQLYKTLQKKEKLETGDVFLDINNYLEVILTEKTEVDILQQAINIAEINLNNYYEEQHTNNEIWKPWETNILENSDKEMEKLIIPKVLNI